MFEVTKVKNEKALILYQNIEELQGGRDITIKCKRKMKHKCLNYHMETTHGEKENIIDEFTNEEMEQYA